MTQKSKQAVRKVWMYPGIEFVSSKYGHGAKYATVNIYNMRVADKDRPFMLVPQSLYRQMRKDHKGMLAKHNELLNSITKFRTTIGTRRKATKI